MILASWKDPFFLEPEVKGVRRRKHDQDPSEWRSYVVLRS